MTLLCCTIWLTDPSWWHCFVAPFALQTPVDDIVLLHHLPYRPQLMTLFCCTICRTDPSWWHCFVAPFALHTPVDYIVLLTIQTPVDDIVLLHHLPYISLLIILFCCTLFRTYPSWWHCFVARFALQTSVDNIVLLTIQTPVNYIVLLTKQTRVVHIVLLHFLPYRPLLIKARSHSDLRLNHGKKTSKSGLPWSRRCCSSWCRV